MPLTGVQPQIQGLINTGDLSFKPLATGKLGFTPQSNYAPRGGGIIRNGRTVVPKAPAGQWWDEDYTGGDPMFTLAGQVGPGGYLNMGDLGGLGVQPGPINIGATGRGIGLGDIEGDFEFQAALRDIAAANAADAAAARESIESLATGWGGDLSGLVKQGLISQATADVAGKNQFSTMAELGRALNQGIGQSYGRLAARGILSSGAVPAVSEELNRQYQRESTTGLQSLMSEIKGIRSQQAQAAAERQGMLSSVRASIAGRLSQMPQFQQTPAMQAFWNAEEGGYVDDWGRVFDRNGNRVR